MLFPTLSKHNLLRHSITPQHLVRNKSNTLSASTYISSLLSLLQRCATFPHLRQIHAQMLLSGVISDPLVVARLVAASALSFTPYSAAILRSLPYPSAFPWNAAIRGFSGSDDPKESVSLYKQMLASNAQPDNHTYPFLFKACARMPRQRLLGASVFGQVLRLGLVSDVFVVNAGVYMFAVCGGLEDARKLFAESSVRDLVTWNSMINACVLWGKPKEGLRLFREMEAEKVWPDEVTMLGLVSCCTQLQDLELGRKFHRYIEENGLEFTIPLTNALMDMYVKCGSLELARVLFEGMKRTTVVSWTTMVMGYAKFGLLDEARRVFDEMPERDVVPWNALITGYVQHKRYKYALALFNEMQASNVKPDEVTMVSLLCACSQLGALDMGLWIHRYIEKHNFFLSVALGTSLVDMYAKCGNIKKSLRVFREIPERNALTWTAIICGLASHGDAGEAIEHFRRMIEIGLAPDEVTFIGVLSACCHAGLVNEGRSFFSQMSSNYKLSPRIKHYSCMVDLLGRAGLLNEALELIKAMPIEPDAVVWGALFFACRIHGNVSMGEYAAARLIELDPQDSGIYVLLANMYVEANMRGKADRVRLLMKQMGVEKTPGCSSIEMNGMVHEFIVRDKLHPERKEIYACLIQLARQMDHVKTMSELGQADFV